MAATVLTHALRECTNEQSCLSRADGSAMLSQGNSTVLVGIYGPGEVRIQKEIADKAFIEVVYKPKTGIPGTYERKIENIIRNTCEAIIMTHLYPRTMISINVQELQNAGSLLACILNAICSALLDSGIEMKQMIAAVTCAVKSDNIVVVDPSSSEEKEAEAVMMFAFSSNDRSVVACETSGSFSSEEFDTCLAAARNASDEVFGFFRQSAAKRLCKERIGD